MMLDFRLWLFLRENFNPTDYDALFNREVAAIWPTIPPEDRPRVESLQNGWVDYIAACLRNSGIRDQSDLQEKIHDIVVKLLISPGGLVKNYNPSRHGVWTFVSSGRFPMP